VDAYSSTAPPPTVAQQDLIVKAHAIAAADNRIVAAWLGGSFAAGTADAYSDIDLNCAITDESADWFAAHWGDVARAKPLFDRTGTLLPGTPVAAAEPSGASAGAYFPADAVNLYFYLLGNLAVVLGRGEVLLAMNGAVMRRDIGLVPVMLAENGVRKHDGRKRLNRGRSVCLRPGARRTDRGPLARRP
jgi:hypothetical protein